MKENIYRIVNDIKMKIIYLYKDVLLEIYNDYKRDYLKYLKIFKKKIRKLYRKIRYYFLLIKDNLLKYENRKKYLTITGVLILFNLLLINFYVSYGYYYGEGVLSLIKGVVGNLYASQYDVVQLIYLENINDTGSGSGNYYLVSDIPTYGYTYSGYKCMNGSSLIYDNSTNEVSVTTDKKEICSLYFDVVGSVDLNAKIMLESEVGSNKYVVGERIPYYGYKYSTYECDNDGVIEYNSPLHTVKLSSSSKDYCSIYFTKESSDIDVNLYVEDNYQNEDYISMESIPSNNVYSINENRSICKNNNNERIDTSISYSNGYIEFGVGEIASCDVYLDKVE